jgi:hypothetical protein
MKLECPTCKQQAISSVRKMSMGPATPAKCQHCDEKVGVSFAAMLAGVPFVAAILAGLFIESYVIMFLLVVAGFAALSVIHLCVVPLEVK